jgi:hypothetical protein
MSWEAEFPCHGASSPPRRPQTWRKWSNEAGWPDQYDMNTWVRVMVWYVVKTIILYIDHSASLLKPSSLGKSCSLSVFRWEKTNLPGPLDRLFSKHGSNSEKDEVQIYTQSTKFNLGNSVVSRTVCFTPLFHMYYSVWTIALQFLRDANPQSRMLPNEV